MDDGRREFVLDQAKPLSPGVRGLRFRTADGAPFDFVAGQWVDLHASAAVIPKRAYSIANAPANPTPDVIEFAVTRVEGGAMSNVLHTMAAGTVVEVSGPHGFFTREAKHAHAPAVFVGTGTGLAPLRSMLQQEVLVSSGPPLVLLFGCRTPDDILWRDELEAWMRVCPRLRVEVTLSRPDSAWSGRRGYVQAHLADVAAGLQQPQVYVCGLSRMVQDARRVLKDELGFTRQQIQSERYD